MQKLAKLVPRVHALKGYSVPKAAYVPNASQDLVFVDAAHDYRNCRADILAYWPKLKASGVMAGHDFTHHRNWAEVRQDKANGRGVFATAGKGKKMLPAYGVAQAVHELFGNCEVHVMYSVWWVEVGACPGGPMQLVTAEAIK